MPCMYIRKQNSGSIVSLFLYNNFNLLEGFEIEAVKLNCVFGQLVFKY